jgi:hypothetical protein
MIHRFLLEIPSTDVGMTGSGADKSLRFGERWFVAGPVGWTADRSDSVPAGTNRSASSRDLRILGIRHESP